MANGTCEFAVPGVVDTLYDLSFYAGVDITMTDAYTGDADAAEYVYTFGICTSVKPPSPDCDGQTSLPVSAAFQTCKVNMPACAAGTCNSLGTLDGPQWTLTDPRPGADSTRGLSGRRRGWQTRRARNATRASYLAVESLSCAP